MQSDIEFPSLECDAQEIGWKRIHRRISDCTPILGDCDSGQCRGSATCQQNQDRSPQARGFD
tara:strand:- start:113 stop:298 length:186 start_codon:yes stop_codon:yes gene_type:complete